MGTAEQPLIDYQSHDGIIVGTIHATRMLDAVNVANFGNQVVKYVSDHPGIQLMLDFKNVSYLSSAALTELLRINEAAIAIDGGVRLCGLSKDIQKVFEITNLDKLFAITTGENVDKAVRRFKRALKIAHDEDEWDRKRDE